MSNLLQNFGCVKQLDISPTFMKICSEVKFRHVDRKWNCNLKKKEIIELISYLNIYSKICNFECAWKHQNGWIYLTK